MRRCPECRRDYYDDSLSYCLDDGAALVDGPADGTATAILPSPFDSSEAATQTLSGSSLVTNESLTGTPQRDRGRIFLAIAACLLLIAAVAAGVYFYRSAEPAANDQIQSVAVMPFINASSDPDIDYLSDGITESLINSLSQVPNISVKARSSVFSYKGKEVSPQQVAKDLSVEAVLNGRVVRIGDQIQMNVELVQARTGNQLWGEQYTRKVADILQLQSEIARDVSGKLKAKLTGADQQKIAKNYTQNTEAYQLYLRGRYHWNKRKAEDIKKSIDYFRQAIDADPTYALAYAGLADSYILVSSYMLGPSAENYPKARIAAQRAVEIDPSLAEAHNALASVMENYDWKFEDAENEWKKAIDLNPNYATAHQWYAEFLRSMGRYPEALNEIKRGRDLDPLSLIINGLYGDILRINGQQDAAYTQLQKTLEMDPNFPRTHLFLASYYQDVGRYNEAVDEYAKSFQLNGIPQELLDEFSSKMKNAYKTGGPKLYFRTMAEIFEGQSRDRQPPMAVMAMFWTRAGEPDKAFEILDRAYDKRDDSVLMIKDPSLDPVKSDPRYKDLIRRVGLPE